MNDYASLPWYVRHGGFALFFAAVAVGSGYGVRGVLAIFLGIFACTMTMQIIVDGWDHKKW